MSAARKELQEALCRYTTDTLSYIITVKGFCGGISRWMLCRETELNMMMDIKHRVDNITLNIDHVTNSKNKGEAIKEYVKSKVTQVTADSKRAELKDELDGVLKDTLEGLKRLDCFLDAVEKLAVTSLHVFMENKVLHLPTEIEVEDVQVVITAARLICHLLLEFKRDAKAFFFAKLQNMEVLIYQLDKYIQSSQKICDFFERSPISELSLNLTVETVVDLDVDLSEEDIQRMLDHVNQLREIRMNQAFRMVFLFQEKLCSKFINEFSQRQPRMLQFLKELEENAVQLDRMNKGAKISSVAGSSVGAVGGVLSIIGLALIPFTAGVSLGLTMTGIGLGITSGVNSLVTTATEMGVNYTHQKKASEVFQSFMEDVQTLQNCLEDVIKMDTSGIGVAVGATKLLFNVGTVGKSIDSLVDAASAVKMLKSEDLITGAGMVVAQEGKALGSMSRVASDVPDIGQAAVKGPLALTKSARVGLMAANALFVGLDIFFICKDSISLAKGTEAEMSSFLRARAELWSSEMDSWQRIHDLLNEGLLTSEKNNIILETPFYPVVGEKKQIKAETEMEIPSDEVDKN